MDHDRANLKDRVAALFRSRKLLAGQIRQSREIIERSMELLKHIDELPAKTGEKPWSAATKNIARIVTNLTMSGK